MTWKWSSDTHCMEYTEENAKWHWSVGTKIFETHASNKFRLTYGSLTIGEVEVFGEHLSFFTEKMKWIVDTLNEREKKQ